MASITVKWDKPTATDVQTVCVWWGEASCKYTSFVQMKPTVTSWKITGLTKGKMYYAAVTVINAEGTESPFSKEVHAIAK